MQDDIYSRVPVLLVKRIGGSGVHLINEADFDPSRHELADGQSSVAPEAKRRGRPPKPKSALMEKSYGNR